MDATDSESLCIFYLIYHTLKSLLLIFKVKIQKLILQKELTLD